MTRYQTLVYFPDRNEETIQDFRATSLGEALAMAEAFYAGRENVVIGIPAGEYQQAKIEKIAFNMADGRLL